MPNPTGLGVGLHRINRFIYFSDATNRRHEFFPRPPARGRPNPSFQRDKLVRSGGDGWDGVLVAVRRDFYRIEILDEGARVCVQPGVTVRAANARLARFGRP
jgi:hypothetical protein